MIVCSALMVEVAMLTDLLRYAAIGVLHVVAHALVLVLSVASVAAIALALTTPFWVLSWLGLI